jgi:dihydropteroate synthase
MGVLNVTPDSFSDGGRYMVPEVAVDHALTMTRAGATIIDVGAESTRPGSEPVGPEEQITRAIPVIESLRAQTDALTISIDTTSARVAREAIEAGARIVNDTSALRDDPNLVRVVAESGAAVVLMHRRGTPKEMQKDGGPEYTDVVAEVLEFLSGRVDFAVANGVLREKILIDPGLGFGKKPEHNFQLIRRLGTFFKPGLPVVLGASRKSFVGLATEVPNPADRDIGSIAVAVYAAVTAQGSGQDQLVLRVHDVPGTVQAMRVCRAILES